MMFELPHFAVELLVILPCVQVIHMEIKKLEGEELHSDFLTLIYFT